MVASFTSSVAVLLLVMAVGFVATTVRARDLYETNVLHSGQRLRGYDTLTRPGGLTFGSWSDCQFCIRKKRSAGTGSWCTQTNVKGSDCSFTLQRNGDLVVYGDTENRLWSSNTAGRRGDYILLLQDNGTIVLYGDPIWTSREWPQLISSTLLHLHDQQNDVLLPPRTTGGGLKAQLPSDSRYDQNVLYEGEHLVVNEELRSKSYRLAMQEDCNLVLYSAFKAIWQTYTAGNGTNCKLEMRRWGNLIVTNEWDYPVWSSGTARLDGDYILILQDDGNLVVYSKALWSKTHGVDSAVENKVVVNGNNDRGGLAS